MVGGGIFAVLGLAVSLAKGGSFDLNIFLQLVQSLGQDQISYLHVLVLSYSSKLLPARSITLLISEIASMFDHKVWRQHFNCFF